MTSRRSLLVCALGLAGCFDAHATTDGSVEIADAGADAGDEPSITSCAPAPIGAGFGEPCFCNGPVALAGDVLYRRGVGIEVYDLADPRSPALVRVIDERASSMGALIVDASLRTLYSISDFAPGLWIYDLATPLAPSLLGSFALTGTVHAGALDGSTLVVSALEAEGGFLHVVDVSTPAFPRLERSITLPGRPGSVAIDGRTTAVVVGTDVASSSVLLIDLGSGETMAALDLAGGEFGRTLVIEGDVVFLGGESLLTVLRREGATLSITGVLEGESAYTRGLVRDGSLLLMGGDVLRVVDVSNLASPRLLGASPGPLGDIGGLAWRGELAYVSGGNGLSVVSLNCE